MTAAEGWRELKNMLNEAGVSDAGFDARCLLEHAGCAFPLDAAELPPEQWQAAQALAQRRCAREPLQYILGSWPFLDLELKVGPGVLVPRPETEELCQTAAQLMAGEAMPVAADLCSGSGALALGLQSLLPDALVAAVEKEEEAFAYLLQNVAAFGQTHEDVPVAIQADVMEWHRELEDESYDLVVCNPPYVTQEEYGVLEPELYAEPRAALVPQGAQDAQDGLVFYREIPRLYRAKLRRGGWLAFEIGASQGGAVCALLRKNGYSEVHLCKDLSGHDRMALGRRPEAD